MDLFLQDVIDVQERDKGMSHENFISTFFCFFLSPVLGLLHGMDVLLGNSVLTNSLNTILAY